MTQRLSDQNAQSGDLELRPQSLSQFTGQKHLVDNLSVFIDAAKKRSQALDHVLLSGPPGLGKTTLSQIIAKELGANFKPSSGPILVRAGDLAALLTNLQPKDILFIDEIHRLPLPVEEMLYSAMEDFRLDIMIGEGPSARSVRIDVHPFTLVGATTRTGLLSTPLRDRFGILLQLDLYEPKDLFSIIQRAANLLNFDLTAQGAWEIAYRSRGTPRIAGRLLRRMHDFALVEAIFPMDASHICAALQRLGVDEDGLDKLDLQYLYKIAQYYQGGPVGIDTLSALLSEEKDSIEEVIEPYLLQQGFLQRNSRGRVLTQKAWKKLNILPPLSTHETID